ncbi:CPA1 family monovalent cation:H+ antiporter [Geodermatophilus bullaregiensis]|uniref:Na+/H+ antiporter n=1 Tax=Geodermatophilus bullaregiensis TaxID=1564160 RepID=UPI00195BF213|nr:Na+/H+ antiporter [Geodermatophilus bullaregiensis]MBM7808823.1 CPA1 family monovalent cation:H+ antiporter [Geodermatophilus bullaregiensis]
MHAETVLLLALAAVAVIVAVRWLGERTGLPAAALLTVAGLVYGLLPGPNLTLDPEIVLMVLLPPLLYSAALDSSLIAIRANLRTVVSLSVLLVLVTALTVGAGFALLVPGATLAAGIALGAAVAPPDPVAALAIGRRVGLPPRMVTLIQGEGLLNDATALTLLTVAVAAATGDGFSTWSALGQFALSSVGGIAAGLAVAYGIRPLRRLRRDPLSSNAISLATPFLAYLLAESVHVSGVLAVVVAGLVIAHNSPYWVSGATRLQTDAVWRLVDFLLEGVVFLLIGNQLPAVIGGLGRYETSTVVVASAVTVGAVLLVRPLWLWLTEHAPQALHMRLGAGPEAEDDDPRTVPRQLSGREITVLSWAGTRGVISLAAIFTLPLTTDSGEPFPARDLLLFCAFLAVLVTLVGQGTTFAPLVRRLGMRADAADGARLRNQARVAAVEAGLLRLDELQAEQHDHLDDAAIEAVRSVLRTRLERYRQRLQVLGDAEGEIPMSPQYEAALRVRRAVIDAERTELLRWRDLGRLPDEGLRTLERELDHQEHLLPSRPV